MQYFFSVCCRAGVRVHKIVDKNQGNVSCQKCSKPCWYEIDPNFYNENV